LETGARSRGEQGGGGELTPNMRTHIHTRWKSQVISAVDVVGPTTNITQFPHAHPSGFGGSLDPLLLINQLSLSLESESS
jgi:hypothetical protein